MTVLLAASGSWRLAAGESAPPLVRVTVREIGNGALLPARLTLLDAEGRPAEIVAEPQPWLAVRPGVVYTGTGEAAFRIPRGRYTLHATRGSEYGLATRRIEVTEKTAPIELRLAREVDTRGYISCDTHIHTRTHSGHGDSTLEERMPTIAGEGIELAIATDHNHHTDYAPVAQATRTAGFFTPVIGNEVTTKVGHFNAFPIRPGSAVPDYQSSDWQQLLAGIRAVPGVRVVVLNHPSNNHSDFIPTDPKRFHPASGESHDGRSWDFDAMEVVTSAALQSDWMKPYRDWFALLNRGRRLVGLGSSDTHDVDRFILGQARTYVASTATQPHRIDVDEACENMLSGKVLVSMGLLTEAWVDDRFGVGDLSTDQSPEMKVRVRVQGPRWVTADRIELYANGQKIASRPVVHSARSVIKAEHTFTLPRPAHDLWLVAIASGPGVDQPYWPIGRPYQPDRAEWDPRVIGSTSPIRVDGDGDGRYTSPLEYARACLASTPGSPYRTAPEARNLMAALSRYDTATAVQAASLLYQQGADPGTGALRQASEAAAPHVRHAFVAYRNLRVKTSPGG